MYCAAALVGEPALSHAASAEEETNRLRVRAVKSMVDARYCPLSLITPNKLIDRMIRNKTS
jgi:hypothetical protein